MRCPICGSKMVQKQLCKYCKITDDQVKNASNKKVKEYSQVIVATEDERIVKVCNELEMDVMLTADTHPTGTDRVAEVAQKVEADLYVIIMGDEPLIEAKDERALIAAKKPFTTYISRAKHPMLKRREKPLF